ncbi:hypothetical protein E4U30_006052 [Claviceps sp. LM220 group G6]|nr:hypothetical protein E4U15_005172 [Claviceps sp. LM218 group G6]KAG6096605.1 hypothetical protein E4U14_007931 [Claviceps sp. LM454 group G7]KAG6099743.1 hypothetical protein E4U30_006052 [Claviceps sp. LM220 group G6]KAG6114881.1 hypothetical protein E4U31_000031 [Claviceps sp. LM219 group G6]
MKWSAIATTVAALAPTVLAQTVEYSATSALAFYTGTRTSKPTRETSPPSGAYHSYASKITLIGANSSTSAGTTTSTGTLSMGANFTATTSSAPKNTQPCNKYVEFCTRKYSNITNVGCHNSPFVRPGNSGSNQELDVTAQLNDGVRFLQGQIQWPGNGTSTVPHFCHTSCDLLDAGPIYDWLGQVRAWVDRHPYDVVTILLGNGNYSDPSLYVPFIEQSGITKYVYTPPFLPMALDDWPTLQEMILKGQRVVMFLDYQANQTKYPWLMDEFSQAWETPFDPMDRAFPCTVQRPPDLSKEAAKDRLYIMNHNLNVEFNVFGISLMVPAVSLLNETNGINGTGSVGLAANNCREDWGRAPNVLNVDYFNYGSPKPCSVFAAAAAVNNVTYDWDNPCGEVSAAPIVMITSLWVTFAAMMITGLWVS